ncbi:MAG: HypC/HybG/HupF family hydrogenase formation chaperone [Nitrospirae bacterium]|nr:MAG: HypC/HybG/HupF family hydrogenase formation chaperone [Nitrospirota bacterium]
MCLAIPGQIQAIHDTEPKMGTVAFGGVKKEVCLALIPEAQVGDYVLVHVGFAISRLDERAAQETLQMVRTLGDRDNRRSRDEIS